MEQFQSTDHIGRTLWFPRSGRIEPKNTDTAPMVPGQLNSVPNHKRRMRLILLLQPVPATMPPYRLGTVVAPESTSHFLGSLRCLLAADSAKGG